MKKGEASQPKTNRSGPQKTTAAASGITDRPTDTAVVAFSVPNTVRTAKKINTAK